jgi:hypothetical protein
MYHLIYIIKTLHSARSVFVFNMVKVKRVRGSVVGWGTMLQAGRSPVRAPDEVNVLNLHNPPSRNMALESTPPLIEMSTRNIPGGRKRMARRADKLAAMCEPNVWKSGSLNLSQR